MFSDKNKRYNLKSQATKIKKSKILEENLLWEKAAKFNGNYFSWS